MVKLKKGDKIRFRRKLNILESGTLFTKTFKKDDVATVINSGYKENDKLRFLNVFYKNTKYYIDSGQVKWIEKL